MSGVKPLFKKKIKKYIMNDLERERGPLVEPIPVAQMEVPTKEYRPSNNEALRDHEIRIRFLSRGCVVSVGCKEIAFESVEKAMEELNNYVANPWEQQQTWRKILD
jgi:hypothetical protein